MFTFVPPPSKPVTPKVVNAENKKDGNGWVKQVINIIMSPTLWRRMYTPGTIYKGKRIL